MTEYAIVYRSAQPERLTAPAALRLPTTQVQRRRPARFQEAVTALRAGLRTAVRLGAGVTLVIGGVAITGGSFGLFAFIGIPVLAVGLGLITSET